MGDTKKAWKEVVTAEDLDAHMLAIGQARVNAEILNHFFSIHRIKNKKIYAPGCGTGQLFEFMDQTFIRDNDFLFTDIRAEFLSRARDRLATAKSLETKVDDIESSSIVKKVDVCTVVLLFEHVNWPIALKNILRTRPSLLFVIIQAQMSQNAQMVNTQRQLRPSIQKFIEVAHPELVERKALEENLIQNGYRLGEALEREVPDNKKMLGLSFQRR